MKHLLTALLLLLVCHTQAQDVPFIEVTASAEQSVIPDRIYIGFTMIERYEDRTKITLDSLERQLSRQLALGGIPYNNLTVNDQLLNHVKVTWLSKGNTLNVRHYQLLVHNTEQASVAFAALESMHINHARITRTEYSAIDSLSKHVYMEAAKRAKEKITFMLAAVECTPGKLLMMYETSTGTKIIAGVDSRSGGTAYYIDGVRVQSGQVVTEAIPEITFEKITISRGVYLKYSIP